MTRPALAALLLAVTAAPAHAAPRPPWWVEVLLRTRVLRYPDVRPQAGRKPPEHAREVSSFLPWVEAPGFCRTLGRPKRPAWGATDLEADYAYVLDADAEASSRLAAAGRLVPLTGPYLAFALCEHDYGPGEPKASLVYLLEGPYDGRVVWVQGVGPVVPEDQGEHDAHARFLYAMSLLEYASRHGPAPMGVGCWSDELYLLASQNKGTRWAERAEDILRKAGKWPYLSPSPPCQPPYREPPRKPIAEPMVMDGVGAVLTVLLAVGVVVSYLARRARRTQ